MASPNPVYVEAPKGTPHRFGLRSVADVRPAGDGRWINGVQYDEFCGTGVDRAYVPCDTPPDGWTKEPFDLTLGRTADALVLYAMAECSLIGRGTTIAEAQAELNAGVDYALEAEFALTAYADAGTTVGTSSDPRQALAALISSWTSGLEFTVHLSPNVALLLGSYIQRAGNGLYLRTGEKVSVGYGYAAGAAQTGVDTGAMFLTGDVFVYEGQSREAEAPIIKDNNMLSLVERPYLVGSICQTKKITLTNLLT